MKILMDCIVILCGSVFSLLVLLMIFGLSHRLTYAKHPPYVKYPAKGGNLVYVYIYETPRGGRARYFDYKFMCKNGKWRYVLKKSDVKDTAAIIPLMMVITLLGCAASGIDSFAIFLATFLILMMAVAMGLMISPLRAYMVLKKDLRIKRSGTK